MEVDVGLGDSVLWGPRSLPKMRGTAPQFWHMYSGKTAGWIKIPLGAEVDLDPRPHCVRWGPARPRKEAQQFTPLWLMSVVAKRSPMSATAELLLAEVLLRK